MFRENQQRKAKLLTAGMLLFLSIAPVSKGVYAAQQQEAKPVKTESIDVDIVILGASYAAGWKLSQLGELTVVNKGVGGQESHEMLARFEKDVLALHPDYVIIWGFINDIFRADPNRLSERLEKTREDLRAMVEMAQSHGIKPILATEVTTQNPRGFLNAVRGFIGRLRGKPSYAQFVSREVMRVNNWLRGYAKEHSIPVLDIERLFAGEDGLRKQAYVTDDGSHITPLAYEVLTKHVRQESSRLFAR